MSSRGPRYSEEEARAAVAASRSHYEAMRRLACAACGRQPRDVEEVPRSVGHSDRSLRLGGARPPSAGDAAARGRARRGVDVPARPLKRRLVDAGLKQPQCEMCGQGEVWRGFRMGLILDHVNGVWDDNRLENLRFRARTANATLGRHRQGQVVDRHASTAGRSSRPSTASSGSARGRACAAQRRARTASSARPTSNSWPSSPRRAFQQSVASRRVRQRGRKWVRAYERDRQLRASERPRSPRRSASCGCRCYQPP